MTYDSILRPVKGGGKTYHRVVEIQDKCHLVRPPWHQMLTSRGPLGVVVQGNRVLMVIFRIMIMLADSIKLERATDHSGITSRIDLGSFR